MSVGNVELVEQFAIETQQHLDEIEPILLQAEWTTLDKSAIAALFRSFHSIKGLARLLDLHGLEMLAHHAESLLGEIRANRLAFRMEIQGLLLEALDAIRVLRERGIAGSADAPAPAGLVAALEAASNAGGGSVGPAMTVEAASSTEVPLHDDHQTLIYFAEMMAECLPNLAVLVGGAGDPVQAADDIDTLMVAAERVRLDGLHARLERLSGTAETPIVDRLAAVAADARRFGQLIDQDTGADGLLTAAIGPFRRAQREAASTLIETLPSAADAARQAADRLVSLAAAGVADGGIAALVLQALGDPATLEASLAAVGLLAADLTDLGGETTDLLTLAAERLRETMRNGRELTPPLRKVLEDRGVDPRRLDGIGPIALARLATILEGGERQLVSVNVSLPSPGERSAFVDWLDRHLPPASALAVTLEGSSGVSLLTVTSEPQAALEADILAAYPADVATIEVRLLDGQFLEHPWAPVPIASPAGGGETAGSQVRLPVEMLDKLFGRIGEFFAISSALNMLAVDSQAPRMLQRLADHVALKAPTLMPAIEILQRQQTDLSWVESEIHRLISLIHEATLGLRVIPLDSVFNRFPRMIRDLAKMQGKLVRFEARTDAIKVDKGMTELLADPLMHMLRNAVDHGIESPQERTDRKKPRLANIRLSATQNGNRITVEVADDGRGVDTELVRRCAVAQGLVMEADSHRLSKDQIHRFIFAAGFTTTDQVTDTSGRGVGMDVALVNVSRLGGRIDIHSTPGQGATFRLDLPLSAAMVTVLLAETAVQTVAFPERMVVESATLRRDSVQYVNGQRAILMHDRFLPLFRAADLLRLPDAPNSREREDLSIIVAMVGRFRYGVEVNQILRRHELLMREAHPRIAQLPGIGGVSTLGTDRIVLVVDPEGLTELARCAVVPGLRAAVRAAE